MFYYIDQSLTQLSLLGWLKLNLMLLLDWLIYLFIYALFKVDLHITLQ